MFRKADQQLCRTVTRSGNIWGMSDHLTLRVKSPTMSRLRERARRAGLPVRTLTQRYIEEGLRHDLHPLIHFVDGPTGRRAAVLGTGLDVWEVIATVQDNAADLEESTTYLDVPHGLVQAAVAYYGAYQDEIDYEISLNQAEWDDGLTAVRQGQQALEA